MKRIYAALALCALLARSAAADAWDDLAVYRYNSPSNAAESAFGLLTATPADQRGPIEDGLISVITRNDATQDGKAFACRMLQQVGTEKAVKALEGLLTDLTLSHYACLTLERMVDSKKAGEALRNALKTAPDTARVGILGSIGVRRDAGAVKHVSALAESGNPAVAAAAIGALGRIGTQLAADRLLKLEAGDGLGDAYAGALIDCAQRLGGPAGLSLCLKAFSGDSDAHRIAALQQIPALDPDKGAEIVLAALQGDDIDMRNGAFMAVAFVQGEQFTKAAARMLDEFSGERKAGLIEALVTRGDAAALDGIGGCLESEDVVVRNAAISGVALLGDASVVKTLLGFAVTHDASTPVVAALALMPGEAVDTALIDALSADTLRITAIKALAARGSTSAVPRLMELVKHQDADTRRESWSTLATLGSESDMSQMMVEALAITDAREQRSALSATRQVLTASHDKGRFFGIVVKHYETASIPAKCFILELGRESGDSAALDLERAAVTSGNADLRKTAVRALAAWPNPNAADDLYELAAKGGDKVERILALRGYIDMAANKKLLLPAARLDMLAKADELAERPEERKRILGLLPEVPTAEALELALKYVGHEEIRSEAELAAARLLWELRENPTDRAREIATKLGQSQSKEVRNLVGKAVSQWPTAAEAPAGDAETPAQETVKRKD